MPIARFDRWIFTAALVLAAPLVMADQAEAVPPTYALHAQALLANATTIKEFCAPCGDKNATLIPARNIEVIDSGIAGFSTLEVDGKELDLAYTYFLEDGQWTNLAMAVGYAVTDVPRTIGDDPQRDIAATFMQTQPGHVQPIEFGDAYDACIERAATDTDALLGCMSTENDRQNSQLNTAYQRVMSELPADRQEQLRAAERLWVQYRTANCRFYLYRKGGTAALVTSSACNLRMTAQRALEIEAMSRLYR